MSYRYKKFQELAWFAVVAAVTAAVTVMVSFDPEAITDWRTWAVSLAAGMVRAAAGAVIAAITVPSPAERAATVVDARETIAEATKPPTP